MLHFNIFIALFAISSLCNYLTAGSHFLSKRFDNFHLLHKKLFHDLDGHEDSVELTDVWRRHGRRGDDSENETEDNLEATKYTRLPLEVTPIHYALHIAPILENGTTVGEQWTAPGNVRISVNAVQAVDHITLHSLHVKIMNVLVTDSENRSVSVVKHGKNPLRYDQYVISLGESLVVGNSYEIYAEFISPIFLGRPNGLYRSQYLDPLSDDVSYLVSTQFEFFNAREVFPCFDEPGLKATFDISIGRSSKFHSLSNSNLLSSVAMKGVPGWFIDTFNTTVKMPTYLVAFVVSDFTYSQANSSIWNGKPARVYGPKYLIDAGAGEIGANTSAHILSFYEEYFDFHYPMPKMDSAAIPGYLYGAMENYGLNIYKDILLLAKPGSVTEHQKSKISSVIAHELAHQYFGNVVTCKWWNNIWLNEGFATYYSFVGQNASNPEFEPMKQLMLEGPQFAFALDSRASSYPLLLTSVSQDDIEDEAIGLPYYKGASMIRMMNAFLTPNTFHKAIQRYIKKWAHGAAEQDNLFEALTEQGHEDGTLPKNLSVKEIMEPWTTQPGYPLVRVISSDDDTVYILYESIANVVAQGKKRHSYWTIPISYTTQDNPRFDDHLPKMWIREGTVVKAMSHNTSKWIFINPETTGYYRVVYDKKLTQLLLNQFNEDHSVISPLARSQLLDDYFALGKQMDIPISGALEFTKYFEEETESVCWSVFLKYLRPLYHFYSESEGESKNRSLTSVPTTHFKGLKEYLVPRLEGALERIGYEQLPEEKGAIVMLRSRLLNWACRFGSSKCLSYASGLFDMWKVAKTTNPIPVDQQEFMYCYGVAGGGVSNWLIALDKSISNYTSGREALLLVRSLGCIKDGSVLKSVLSSTLQSEEEGGNLDDDSVEFLLDAVAENPIGRKIMMEFLNENLLSLRQSLNDTFNPVVHRVLHKLSSLLHTDEELVQLESLFQVHQKSLEDLLPKSETYIFEVRDNIKWMSRYYEPMKVWFDQQSTLL